MNKLVRNVGVAAAVIAGSVLGTAGTASAFETNSSNDAVDHMQSEDDGSVVAQVASEENAMPTESVPGNIVVPPASQVPYVKYTINTGVGNFYVLSNGEVVGPV